ncbi:glycosyltransferase family 2 protein [Pontibacter qinzhouensis]|uniref:Glycosyltransferase family 2 protein n=1 Tax=Pontibacter qinzhouensis TaxID=2603253 RepID=A0A5C8K7G4_9BACT|nr:glycosyltransferase family A protein [Pontibacter qinzhouensis]TXK46966.1 glycosyltransferase family 2 protein [Pontibacter qinzhouensis]
MDPLVSVIVPNFNNATYLEECIDSIYNQTYSKIEVILIDDGSTDNSYEIIKKLEEKHRSLKTFFKENGGPSSARNLGLRKAVGEVLAFIDADDIWLKNKLENQISVLLSKKSDIALSDYNLLIEGKTTPSHEQARTDFDNISPLEFFYDNPLKGSASNVIITRRVYEAVGDWDTYLRSSEDPDYWLRCILNGFQVSYSNTVDVLIRNHSNNARSDNSRMFYFQLMSLDKWIKLLELHQVQVPENLLRKAVRARLSRIRYYANKMGRHDLAISTFFIGLNYFGFRFFDKLTFMQFLKSLKKNI